MNRNDFMRSKIRYPATPTWLGFKDGQMFRDKLNEYKVIVLRLNKRTGVFWLESKRHGNEIKIPPYLSREDLLAKVDIIT